MPDHDTDNTSSNERPSSTFIDDDQPNDEAFDSPDNQGVTPPDSSDYMPIQPLTTTRARREIKAARKAAEDAIKELKYLTLDKPVPLSDLAVDGLVCAAMDKRYPLDDEDEWVASWRLKARDNQLNQHAELALDELEDIHLTFAAALSSLKLISLLDAKLDISWSNLRVIELARKINFKGHELMRGRVPGVSL